ncbi:hypothetical protein GJ496_011378 [Pomphorhynchus laevis]|nr:hypothetical protein GJ496_011378 [Pomphorhynchus laevis]
MGLTITFDGKGTHIDERFRFHKIKEDSFHLNKKYETSNPENYLVNTSAASDYATSIPATTRINSMPSFNAQTNSADPWKFFSNNNNGTSYRQGGQYAVPKGFTFVGYYNRPLVVPKVHQYKSVLGNSFYLHERQQQAQYLPVLVKVNRKIRFSPHKLVNRQFKTLTYRTQIKPNQSSNIKYNKNSIPYKKSTLVKTSVIQ